MTLPCTASRSVHPDNEAGSYTTVLARPLDLAGQWEVGLSEAVIPQLAIKFSEGVKIITEDRTDRQNPKKYFLDVPNIKYSSLHELSSTLNLVAPHAKDVNGQSFYITFKNGYTKLYVAQDWWVYFADPGFCKTLGVTPHKTYLSGQHQFQSGGLANMVYVYCDIVEHIPVGDSLVPCLRIIPLLNNGEEFAVIRYENPHYIPVAKTEFATIEVEFADDRGNQLDFGGWFSFIKLHFRPKRNK